MKYFVYLFLIGTLFLSADEYSLGHGYKVNNKLRVGGYFSTDYSDGDEKRQFRLDDVAVLAYGDLTQKFSYLVELEAAPFYVKNYDTGKSQTDMNFHYERIYATYIQSEIFNIRIGKQITPIGYWNIEPINVLRETSSNPLYSHEMFPKLLSGIDVFGFLDEDNRVKYHIFTQVTDDIDENYINIKNDLFIGTSLEYELLDEVSFGGAIAYYETKKTDTKKEMNINLFQLNVKYVNYPFLLQTEWAYNVEKEKLLDLTTNQFSGYLQGIYNFNMQHAIITRYEYFDDSDFKEKINIGVVGYSYRPRHCISIKGEYQINSDPDYSKALISFSVLF